ncbi:type II toxin-antitoxin system PemK/MazF family toxin [Clostridium sp. HBUAS56010]|uniref:type II toxin-antitoxin system PemK/MazF family toxin n=1 Tax=Clostridium sp. HBUAS56010 TaxID=2571127 RepID=UPI0011788C8A|nr:type II toxin-antitoxin system PemK/MazF family toxin [Clostridium sp. HBUAS56010]
MTNKFENLYKWSAHKLRLQEKFFKNDQKKAKYPRGAIYACYLGENIGHEKSRLEARPCLIVSSNGINYKSTNVIIVPLSKDIKYKDDSSTELKYDWHYVLYKTKYNKLSFDSAIQCEDIRCVSKSRFGKFITKISDDDMLEIKKRLKSTLQI